MHMRVCSCVRCPRQCLRRLAHCECCWAAAVGCWPLRLRAALHSWLNARPCQLYHGCTGMHALLGKGVLLLRVYQRACEWCRWWWWTPSKTPDRSVCRTVPHATLSSSHMDLGRLLPRLGCHASCPAGLGMCRSVCQVRRHELFSKPCFRKGQTRAYNPMTRITHTNYTIIILQNMHSRAHKTAF